MMILELHRQGLSITAISRRTGRDPKTVRKYIRAIVSTLVIPRYPPANAKGSVRRTTGGKPWKRKPPLRRTTFHAISHPGHSSAGVPNRGSPSSHSQIFGSKNDLTSHQGTGDRVHGHAPMHLENSSQPSRRRDPPIPIGRRNKITRINTNGMMVADNAPV